MQPDRRLSRVPYLRPLQKLLAAGRQMQRLHTESQKQGDQKAEINMDMSDSMANIGGQSPFEQIKKLTLDGEEYWSARDLSGALDYVDWVNFSNVISKARKACVEAGEDVREHFSDVTDMIQVGKGAVRDIQDIYLSRHACYLIAMNGDPRKKAIAEAQVYFAIQTRRQEAFNQLTDDKKRILLRNRVRNVNANLNQAAHESGVEDFAGFHNAGYEGLYNGYGAADLKRKKRVPASEELLDRMGREELAANEFRLIKPLNRTSIAV